MTATTRTLRSHVDVTCPPSSAALALAGRHDALPSVPDHADLLADQHELQDNTEIMNSFSLWPQEPTLKNYRYILTDYSWYVGYINSSIYVVSTW
jgi:hypothetical protein